MTETEKGVKAVVEALARQIGKPEPEIIEVICAAYRRGKDDMLDTFESFLKQDTCRYYASVEIRNRNLGFVETLRKEGNDSRDTTRAVPTKE